MIARHFTPGAQLVLKTPGEYSMETAVAILRWLEQRDYCLIADDRWRSAGFGDLVEVGIRVQVDNIKFRIMCSYDDIFVDRVAGNKNAFDALCDEICRLEFETT